MIVEIMEAFKHLKIGKTPGPTDVYAEMILPSEDVGISALMELYHSMQDGNGMPEDRADSIAIPTLKGKGNIINCHA